MNKRQTNLTELIEELLKPELYQWKIVKDNGNHERFEPLTLIESFIESEMDFSSAAKIFDIVRKKLYQSEKDAFTHKELQAIVIDSIMESDHKNSISWLRNYANIFGPDINSMTNDQGYVSARNAGELKKYIVKQMCEQVGANSLQELEMIIGKSEVDSSTNRVLKIIRYCGFYKIEENFLLSFCQQLATCSVKELIPVKNKDENFIRDLIKEAQLNFENAQHYSLSPSVMCRHFLELTLEFLGEALICSFDFLPRTGSRTCFYQFITLLSDGQNIALEQENATSITQVSNFYEQISRRLKNANITIDRFLDFVKDVHHKVFEHSVQSENLCYVVRRFIRLAKIILEPSSKIDALRSIGIDDNNANYYLDMVADYLTSREYDVQRNLIQNSLEIYIGNKYNNLLQFGDKIKLSIITSLEHDTMPEILRKKVKLFEQQDSILVFILQSDISQFCIDIVRDIFEKSEQCIILINEDQFESSLSVTSEFCDRLYDFFQKIVPSVSVRNPVFDEPFPANIDKLPEYWRSEFESAWKAFNQGMPIEASNKVAVCIEDMLHDQIFLFLELCKTTKDADDLQLSILKQLDRKGLGSYLTCVSLPLKAQFEKIHSIFHPFIPSTNLINQLKELRDFRNKAVHTPDIITRSDVRSFIKMSASVAVNFVQEYWHRTNAVFIEKGEHFCVFTDGNVVKFDELETERGSVDFQDGLIVQCVKSGKNKKHLFLTQLTSCPNCDKPIPVLLPKNTLFINCPACYKKSDCRNKYRSIIQSFRHKLDKFINIDPKQISNTHGGNNNMQYRNWLKAIGEGVAKASGPLGAPLKTLLSIMTSEDQAKVNITLDKIIKQQAEYSDETLVSLVQVHDDMKELKDFMLQQIGARISVFTKLPSNMSANLCIEDMAFFGPTSITENELQKELEELYSTKMELFWGDISRTEFPTSRLKRTGRPELEIIDFIEFCKGQSMQTLLNTYSFLLRQNNGSIILYQLVSDLSEAAKLENKFVNTKASA